ncbi:Protein FAR1-RELATED SEQUENCE 6 [Ananas comosus]|uniref:Protein FAR1-RELATED SEQUENCE n=1 Tax=Ananas comosus TaxID=4615 RepID=A0A199V6Z6_ANACO|nr:Protein FAR1-RELATED SEQUENCE 6 [Ananas comosus]
MEDQSSESSKEDSETEHIGDEIQCQVGSGKNNPANSDTELIPKLGMVFGSEEEALQFYMGYAYRTGFGIVRRSNNTIEGYVYRTTFICHKGGKSRVKKEITRPPRKQASKTGCKAKMIIKDHHFQNRWEVVVVELEHNHPLEPNIVKFMNCFKKSPFFGKKQLLIGDSKDAPPSNSVDAVSVQGSSTQRDSRIEIGNIRKLELEEGDLEVLLSYFDKMQDQNPYFFYSLDMNEEGQLRNVFWADARSRGSYSYYGDVVKVSVANFTDLSNVLFITFTGVNHHGQEVLLACGLVTDRTFQTYTWLFNKFLRCMNDRPPNAIITDHCRNIVTAIRKVFPHVQHRFCLWSILKALPEKLRGVEEMEAIGLKFQRVVYDSLLIPDFEKEWQEMIGQFKLEGNEWFSNLYEIREHWAPVFVKDTFWAGMSITERGDSISSVSDGWSTSKTSLQMFLERYDDGIKSIFEKEAYEEFRSIQMRPQLLTGFPFEEQVSRVYTVSIFEKFQCEVKHLFQVSSNVLNRRGSVVSYVVTEFVNGKKIDYRVAYDNVEDDIWCICRSFQHRGILCRHALSVLRQELVMLIPSKYIITRWRNDFKRLQASIASPFVAPTQELGSFDDLYRHTHRYFLEIVEIGATNLGSKEYALSMMKEVKDKVIAFEKSLRDQRINSEIGSTGYSYNPINEDFADDRPPAIVNTKGWEPSQAHSKGRSRKKKPTGLRGAVLNPLNKNKTTSERKRRNTSSNLNPRNNDSTMNNDAHVQHEQLHEGWALPPSGTQESFPYGVETISFDLSQYNAARNFQWPESSRFRIFWKEP